MNIISFFKQLLSILIFIFASNILIARQAQPAPRGGGISFSFVLLILIFVLVVIIVLRKTLYSKKSQKISKNLIERRVIMSTQPPKFYKNPSLATILSFFVMGLGQIYNGQIGKGIMFIILYGISWLLMFVVIGFITTPILWIWGMIDASISAKKINEKMAAQ